MKSKFNMGAEISVKGTIDRIHGSTNSHYYVIKIIDNRKRENYIEIAEENIIAKSWEPEVGMKFKWKETDKDSLELVHIGKYNRGVVYNPEYGESYTQIDIRNLEEYMEVK